jgi:hypothetical protein
LSSKVSKVVLLIGCHEKRFSSGCQPIIGLDGCFLKWPYKVLLLPAISRDANNMYLVIFAVVEAKVKDNWSWFLETLLLNLGTPPTKGWTFISDRKGNPSIIFLHLFNFCYATNGFDLMYM